MILKLSLDLPEDQEYVRTTRLLSRTILDDLGVIEEDKDDVELIVSELCANVVRHAKSSEGRYQVVIEYHDGSVVVTVEDKGAGFAPEEVPEPGSLRPDHLLGGERFGGFGVPLVKALSDRLQFELTEPHGTKVQAEKKLHYTSKAAEERARRMEKSKAGEAEVTQH